MASRHNPNSTKPRVAQLGRLLVVAMATAMFAMAGVAPPAQARPCVAGDRGTAAVAGDPGTVAAADDLDIAATAGSGGALGWAAGVGVLLMAGAVVFVLYRRLRKPGRPKDPDQ